MNICDYYLTYLCATYNEEGDTPPSPDEGDPKPDGSGFKLQAH